MKVAGGVTFPKASFEARSCCCVLPPAEWLVVCVCVVEAIAERAVEEAPEFMRRHLGYPLRQGKLLGKPSCRVKAFEKDLDGIRVASLVVFEWRFSHKIGDVLVEANCSHKHRAASVYYGKVVPRPPLQIRTACCVVVPSVRLMASARLATYYV